MLFWRIVKSLLSTNHWLNKSLVCIKIDKMKKTKTWSPFEIALKQSDVVQNAKLCSG